MDIRNAFIAAGYVPPMPQPPRTPRTFRVHQFKTVVKPSGSTVGKVRRSSHLTAQQLGVLCGNFSKRIARIHG